MEKNLLPKKEQGELWVPRVVFENTEHKAQTVMDEMTSTNIKNLNISSFKITDETNAEAVKQYSGDENLLVSTRFYNTRFNCKFQMATEEKSQKDQVVTASKPYQPLLT